MVTPLKIEISFADLLDVINSHNNPAVAMSILDGSYVSPLTPQDEFSRYHKNHSIKNDDDTRDHYQLTFVSYNKWSDEVIFKKDHPKAWRGHDTMSLQEWRGTCYFNPYPVDWCDTNQG